MELAQVAQRVIEMPRAVAFYERLLGAPPVAAFDPPGLTFFTIGGTRLLLDGNTPQAIIYLKVDDVSTAVEALRADGVTILAEPHIIFSHPDGLLGPAGTDEWMAMILDSEGNRVGLISWAPAEAAQD